MSPTEQQLSTICTNCGLCCDGTLYFVAPLTKSEHESLIPVLDVTTAANGDTFLQLPCTALSGSCCTMYDSRPQICRGYRCGVLDSVVDGSLDPQQAAEIVSQVRSLARTFATHLAASGLATTGKSLCQKLRKFDWRLRHLAPEQRRTVNPVLLLTAGTLKIMLSKYFKVLELAADPAAAPPVDTDE